MLDYGIQIARALAHAHERQILHKDLKSANVIVTSDQRIKVVDFGIARRMGPAGIEQVTIGGSQTSRVVAGTPAYMAPEVLRGEAADVRSDVWALGVLLYEMASGTHPFSGLTAFEVIASIMAGPPHALRTSMPPGLRTVVQRCLTVDRAERLPTARRCGARTRGRAREDRPRNAGMEPRGVQDALHGCTDAPACRCSPPLLPRR